MASDEDTGTEGAPPRPPAPPEAPSDWDDVVRWSAWADIERLGRWRAGTTPVGIGQDPSTGFVPVSAGTLGQGGDPIYVVVHGWAPGYRAAVDAAGGRLQWWGRGAAVAGRWASDWCWAPVVGPASRSGPGIVVDPTGMVQQIAAFDRSATILAYSWIDDSATPSGTLHLDEVYASEAYTHLNGIRLANALQQAITPTFFARGGDLRLVGHSHGSKVATVAALTLQQRGLQASHLTILDSPESDVPLLGNGANLLATYLDRMDIPDPVAGGGTYVDSYASYFGVTYASTDPLSPVANVVDVALAPSPVYGDLDPSDCHTYAAAWYGGAAAGAAAAQDPPVGLAWPPVPPAHTPAMNQRWGGPPPDQWTLTAGASKAKTFRYGTHPLTVTPEGTSGNVTVGRSDVTFGPAAGQPWSMYHGRYDAQHTDQYGIAFDLEWRSPQPQELFVVSIGGWETYTLLVLDGGSIPGGTATPIAINSDILVGDASIHMWFLGRASDPGDQVRVSGFRWVEVGRA